MIDINTVRSVTSEAQRKKREAASRVFDEVVIRIENGIAAEAAEGFNVYTCALSFADHDITRITKYLNDAGFAVKVAAERSPTGNVAMRVEW